MLVIQKNKQVNLFFTLKEKVTLTNPYYLFVFTSDISQQKVSFIQTNVSTHQERFDQFVIIESNTNLNPLTGVVEFLPVGSWTYKIYEQLSSSNLLESNTGNLLETGIAKVIGIHEAYNKYVGQDLTYKVYERN